MRFTVILLPRAERDVDQILGWLYQRSPAGAATWGRRWLDVIESLEQSADSYPLAPEDEHHHEPIRDVVFKTRRGRRYRAIFTIRDNTVYVMHVRGPGQDIVPTEDLLE